MSINPNYTFKNLLAFNGSGFACISFVVFLSSTQPFFLNEIIGIDDKKIGSVIGTLGMIDEFASIISAPLIGSLNDKINNHALTNNNPFCGLSGSKIIQFTSFILIGISLIGYGKFSHALLPSLIIFRIIFAIGVTGCMSMITVMLNELSNSDFKFGKIIFWRRRGRTERISNESNFRQNISQHEFESESELNPLISDETHMSKKNGKFAALIGISTGLGAIFSVSFFLTLPIKLNNWFPDLSDKSCLQLSYVVIGFISILVSFCLIIFLYNSVKQHNLLKEPEDVNQTPQVSSKIGYLQLLYQGFVASKHDSRIQLAYVGAFVARSTTVTTSVFIPLLVYNFYYHSGICNNNNDMLVDNNLPTKRNCYDGYIFSAILTGVAQTIALLSSPLWGYLIDKKSVGKFKSIFLSSILGIVGCFGLCLLGSGVELYDPRTSSCFIMIGLIGISQIGTIITSMSLVSSLTYELGYDLKKSMIGSISGLYSLSGGLGILVISKLGGWWSDSWIMASFFLLGLFNSILAVVSAININSHHSH